MVNYSRISFLIYVVLISPFFVFSQKLVVQENNGSTTDYELIDVQSIKFDAEVMQVFINDGTSGSFDIADIDFYKIEENDASLETNQMNESVKIYPNPATDKLTIDFKSAYSGSVTIEVIDMKGRKIANIYTGSHNQETSVTWNVENENIQSGNYVCVIKSSNGVISKPITIK